MKKDLHDKIKEIFPDLNNLKILIKILCYHQSKLEATAVHYDKSALTLVHHGDDIKTDPFKICSYNTYNESNPRNLSKMLTPNRYVDSPNSCGVGLLFPGLLFGRAGCKEIKPSPHYVARIVNDYQLRFATIGFLMIPKLDARDIVTNA